MANIVVSTFTNLPGRILDSFRQGFVDALVREGNNILLFKTNQFFEDYNANNTLKITIDRQKLIEAIKNFNPNLFISINHSGLFNGLADALDCPIAIWLLDGPAYLLEPEECKRQAHRYQMYIATPQFRKDLIETFAFPNQKIHDLPFASDFRPYSNHQIYNVSFIGTNFTGYRFLDIIKEHGHNRALIKKLRELIKSYETDLDMQFANRLNKYDLTDVFTGNFDEAYILNIISINTRIKVLDAIENLGLALFGTPDWPETIKYSIGLALSFNPLPIITKLDAETIYNASKISINISHLQARGGLPWRIFDIMSCNSALISDYQEDLYRLFGKQAPIPIYTNHYEANIICKQLLKDKSRRQFIIESCNKIIEQSHRFKHRLKTISEISNLNLLVNKHGNFSELNIDDFKYSKELSPKKNNNGRLSLSNKNDTNNSVIKFSLQLFQSNNLDFTPTDSNLINFDVRTNESISQNFKIANSKTFLRLDIGEHFSQHTDVKVIISSQSSTHSKEKIHLIDFNKDILRSNQFNWQNNLLSCGFDSFCVFQNPFPSSNINLRFQSCLCRGV